MDQAEQYELKGFVATIYAAIRAGPYNDAAADAILSLYPSILRFWNRRFAHHCQLVKGMQSSPTQFLVQTKTASEQEKKKYQENQNRQLSHIAAINTECEAGMKPDLRQCCHGLIVTAEKMSRIIDTSLERRGQLLNRRRFTLAVQFGRGDEDAEPNMRLLTKGIKAHLAHWEPWWVALEGFLRYMHQDLDSELGFFRRFLNPYSAITNRTGAKVIDVLEKRLKRLSEVEAKGVKTLTIACDREEPRLIVIQDYLARRSQVLQELKDSLCLFRETLRPKIFPGRVLRKRKRIS